MDGKVIAITGASSGFGRALGKRLAQKGARLILADVDEKNGTELAREIKALGGSCVFIKCNVVKDLEMLFDTIRLKFGRLDVMINNAGITSSSDFLNDTNWHRVVSVNLNAVIEGTQRAARIMSKQESGGVIVNVSSVSALYPLGLDPVYSASKAGVLALTQALSGLRRKNVRVNAICPYFSPTPLLDGGLKQHQDYESFMKRVKFVPIPLVMRAFEQAILDPSLAGGCLIVDSSGIRRLDNKASKL